MPTPSLDDIENSGLFAKKAARIAAQLGLFLNILTSTGIAADLKPVYSGLFAAARGYLNKGMTLRADAANLRLDALEKRVNVLEGGKSK